MRVGLLAFRDLATEVKKRGRVRLAADETLCSILFKDEKTDSSLRSE